MESEGIYQYLLFIYYLQLTRSATKASLSKLIQYLVTFRRTLRQNFYQTCVIQIIWALCNTYYT